MEIPKDRLLTTEELYEYFSGRESVIIWTTAKSSPGQTILTRFFMNPDVEQDNFIMQAWLIHREATFEEFLEQQPNRLTRELTKLAHIRNPSPCYWYEVSAVAD